MESSTACLVALLCVTVFVTQSDGLSCAPCNPIKVKCRSVSEEKDCEPVKSVCGCCTVCARREGESCGWINPRCKTGLRCQRKRMSKLMFYFGSGTCVSMRKG